MNKEDYGIFWTPVLKRVEHIISLTARVDLEKLILKMVL